MEVDTVANPAASEVSVSVGILSLSDEVVIEQDGDYKIEDEKYLPIECQKVLGFGHSGVVQRVEHKQTKELFAKKVIKFPRKGKGREQAEERYHNEAAIIRSLRTHTHVIRLFASFTTPGSGGLLLQPAADEGDLHDYLDRFADLVEKPANSSTNLEAMIRVLEQAFGCLSSGLVYMHKKGIRHKDIKPRNILIHQGIVIYTDFGASKDTTKDGQCTTEGAPDSMTRKYCAPEVLEFEKRNFAADVFSLGCVFIEMLIRLSRLSEPEGSEEACYSKIMDSLHDLLLSVEISSKLAFLVRHVIDMTAQDSLSRPTSNQVSEAISHKSGFSCSDCRSIDLRAPSVSKPGRADNNQGWTWSNEYQDYYYVTYDQYRQLGNVFCFTRTLTVLERPIYHWSKQSASNPHSGYSAMVEPEMPEPGMTRYPFCSKGSTDLVFSAPGDVRALQGFISGTPQTGWYDYLDTC